jgi:hypothetical protein
MLSLYDFAVFAKNHGYKKNMGQKGKIDQIVGVLSKRGFFISTSLIDKANPVFLTGAENFGSFTQNYNKVLITRRYCSSKKRIGMDFKIIKYGRVTEIKVN